MFNPMKLSMAARLTTINKYCFKELLNSYLIELKELLNSYLIELN
jgi:hypothetical protein